jgi:hypothetical protein
MRYMIQRYIDSIVFVMKLMWLRYQAEKVFRKAQKRYDAAGEEEREAIEGYSHWDIKTALQEIQSLRAGHYTTIARHKGIAPPEGDESYEKFISGPGTRVMTVRAIDELRQAIRRDNKELREIISPISWFISLLALFISFMNYRKPVALPPSPPSVQQAAMPTPSPTPIATAKPHRQEHKHGAKQK